MHQIFEIENLNIRFGTRYQDSQQHARHIVPYSGIYIRQPRCHC
jgi:hypothetical protein